jgi:hypothetical protein
VLITQRQNHSVNILRGKIHKRASGYVKGMTKSKFLRAKQKRKSDEEHSLRK